jgi:hypothetical protein
MSLRRATVIFFFSNLCLHAILGESNQILSSHYMRYVLSYVLTSGVCYLYVCIYLLMHDRSDGGYYYSCMCSLCARIYFSLHVGSEGELVSYVSRGVIFYSLCWCVFVKFVAKRGSKCYD